MAPRFSEVAVVHLALAIEVLCAGEFANDGGCQSVDHRGMHEKKQCLLQHGQVGIRSLTELDEEHAGGISKGLSWTTNIGQEGHKCRSSSFEADFTGTIGGLSVLKGLLLKKGNCFTGQDKGENNLIVPEFTRDISCMPNSTGCHMWCAPVWHSHHDTTDWSAFDSRCSGWDGSFRGKDSVCAQTGRVFTWARAEVPESKNNLDLTFAIMDNCTEWCSPLWVTIYDPKNFAKTFRWCFNRKNDWGVCDDPEDLSVSAWHDRTFKFSKFMQKHGYSPGQFILELAVYSEWGPTRVLINNLKLSHVKEEPAKEAPAKAKLLKKTCGAQKSCGDDHQCCRKGDSEVDAKCCPKDWACCEDSCCPKYYTCTITEAGHTCKPPSKLAKAPARPQLCNL